MAAGAGWWRAAPGRRDLEDLEELPELEQELEEPTEGGFPTSQASSLCDWLPGVSLQPSLEYSQEFIDPVSTVSDLETECELKRDLRAGERHDLVKKRTGAGSKSGTKRIKKKRAVAKTGIKQTEYREHVENKKRKGETKTE